jgi:hypothetical protein
VLSEAMPVPFNEISSQRLAWARTLIRKRLSANITHYAGKVKIIDKLVDAASRAFGVLLELGNLRLDVPAG